MKPTLLHLVSGGKCTGVGRELLLHAKLLAEAGYRVLFGCRPGGTLEEAARAAGLEVPPGLRLDARSPLSLPLDALRLRRLVAREKIAGVSVARGHDHLVAWLAHGSRLPLFRLFSGSAGMDAPRILLARTATRRVLVADPSWLAAPQRLRGGAAPGGSVSPSGFGAESLAALEAQAALAGVFFVPAGVDTHRFSPDRGGSGVRRELRIRDEETLVGLVAPFKPDRGHGALFRALAIARAEAPGLKALLVASHTRRERAALETAAREAGVADAVALFDPGERFLEALAAIDLGVLFHPGSGGTARAAVELMSMARPLLLGSAGVLPWLAAGGEAAVPLPSGDPAADLAAGLVRLAGDPDERHRLGLAARARVETLFSRRVLQARLVRLWEGMLRAEAQPAQASSGPAT